MTLISVKPKSRVRKPVIFPSGFDRIFDDFFSNDFPAVFSAEMKNRPSVNIIETGDNFRIELAVPGLDKEDIKVDVEKNVLSISSEKKGEGKEDETYKRREFGYLGFKRDFRLPDTIDIAGIKASCKNGILSLTLPKKEEAKELPPRDIKIV